MRKNVWYAVLHQAEAERVIQGFRSEDLLFIAGRPLHAELKTETRYAEVVERSDFGWLLPNNILGVEDSACTSCRVMEDEIDVSFGFNIPPSAILDDIELDVKCAHTFIPEHFYIYVSKDNGANFSYFKSIWFVKDALVACDESIFHGWRSFLSKGFSNGGHVNNLQVRVLVGLVAGGGGGVPTEMWTGYVDALKVRVSYY